MSRPDPIGEIYEAALDKGGLSRMAEILTRAADAGSAVVCAFDETSVEAMTHGLPEDALRRYLSYYHGVNPWYQTGMALGLTLKPVRGADIVPELQFRQTEFYVDFARGLDTVEAIGCGAPISPGCNGSIGIHRGARHRRFDSRDVHRMRRLMPHLQRALQLRRRLGILAPSRIGFAALDALAIGAVICDAAGRILFANTAAEVEARAGTGLVLGGEAQRLGALLYDESRQLLALVSEAANGGPGGAMSITGRQGDRLFVLVAPLPRRFGEEPGRALVTLRAASASLTLESATLIRLFGLTPAEARLTLALLTGRSLAEYGAERGVSENTLRTQLAQVLRKTDTANQRELVRVLSLLPPLR